MTIELLYFDGCPTWEAVHRDLNEIVARLGLNEAVEVIEVPDEETAQRLRFPGSPTVRVNGVDADADNAAGVFTMACRIYWVKGRAQGAPPRDLLETAIRNAQR
ncbi:MAG: DUF2703 domain-containing protein [Chloroflexi bacterium]|nr:DUF2703 domain-containing protein [Chloroflexota bacterium]